MNMKSTGGFTLVELIVVIAILAILAGVAVPAYSGYLKSAEKAGDITALSAVKTAIIAAYATEGEVTSITVTDGDTDSITVEVNDATPEKALAATDYLTYLGQDSFSIDLKTGTTATWDSESGEWTITGTAD